MVVVLRWLAYTTMRKVARLRNIGNPLLVLTCLTQISRMCRHRQGKRSLLHRRGKVFLRFLRRPWLALPCQRHRRLCR